MDDEKGINDAIITYLGFGDSVYPKSDLNAVHKLSSKEDANAIHAKIEIIINKVSQTHIDWNSHTLQSASDLVDEMLRTQHPELSNEARQALIWKFTYDWR